MLLHHQFIKTAKANGSKLAIVDGLTGKHLSYKESLIGSLIFAEKFSQFSDRYIGIMLPNTAGCILSVVASVFCGKIPVMINYSTGAERNIDFARKKCQFSTLITSRKLLEKIACPEMEGMIFLEDLMATISSGNKITAAIKALLPYGALKRFVSDGKEDDTVVIMFTSGSEKQPKGVELSHLSIGSNISSVCRFIGLTDKESITGILPAFHVFGFTTGLWLPLVSGIRVVTFGSPLEAKKIVALVKKEKVTVVVGTPFFLMNYARVASTEDFAGLHYVMSGADKTPDSLFNLYKSKYGLDIIEGYGATETSPIISANPPDAIKRGSIGLPIGGVEVKIVDVNTGEKLGPNQEGKILVKGELLMKGYFNDKQETDAKIEDGWYETGDMGVFDDDGYLWHKGRLKRFVKIGGEMVSLVQVESEIEKLLPEGVECCVVDHPNEKRGATIVAITNDEVDEHEMKQRLKQVLPAIAIPKHFIVMEEMPKMGSGKIDFRKTTELSLGLLAAETA